MANYGSDNVSILMNNGDGTFQTAVNYGAGDGASVLFCADLDGDTTLDLAVASYAGDSVFVLKNNGNGTFQTKVGYGVGDEPYSVFCADLDRDTDLDLAVTNQNSDNISILKNNGNGTFQTAVNYGAGDCPVSVFCADLDGDSDLDIAVANANGGNVSILLNQTVTDVEDDEGIVRRPEGYSLSQNHPNPFNQTTKIEFTLRRSGFVTLSIYDLLGRKVKTLVSEHLSLGHKSVFWDGKNDSGNDVASGIYFYQMRVEDPASGGVGDFTDTKKLMLLK